MLGSPLPGGEGARPEDGGAIHEITHNLAFKGIKATKFLAMVANLPIAIPYAVTFKACGTTLLDSAVCRNTTPTPTSPPVLNSS